MNTTNSTTTDMHIFSMAPAIVRSCCYCYHALTADTVLAAAATAIMLQMITATAT